ncbi:hypothetical protein [Klebsiella quasipneumoniae]|uniref:hypothetical protein n=1 Tax=Klebsiella quasipneumoniae TaxID=1463165 RepID=UPI001909D3C9|nr:hypothetical protein [Klebsiella quasipneumoniae]MBK2831281.1 hypothetical protein [Klebsiella quasipneumoniae]
MSTYKTGNPLGSAAVKDLFDNAENLDFALNSLTALIWTDRLGKVRPSFFGMETSFLSLMSSQESRFTSQLADQDTRFNTFIASSGYDIIGDYTVGTIPEGNPLTITEYNQLIRYNNEHYKLTAATDIPFTASGKTDETWTATDSAHFVSVGDAALRQNLGSGELPGATLVSLNAGTVFDALRYCTPEMMEAAGDGVADDSLAFQAALDEAASRAIMVNGSYAPQVVYLNRSHRITKTLVMDGTKVRVQALAGGELYFDNSAGGFTNNVCITVTNNNNLAAFSGHAGALFRGVKFSCPDRSLDLFYSVRGDAVSANNGACLHALYDCTFRGFNKIFTHGPGGWGWSWYSCQASNCQWWLYLTPQADTYERMSFYGCTWQSGGIAFYINNPNGKVYWRDGSFDYSTAIATMDSGHITLEGHIENAGRIASLIKLNGSGCSVSIKGMLAIVGNTSSVWYLVEQYQDNQLSIDDLTFIHDGANVASGIISNKRFRKGAIFLMSDSAKLAAYYSCDAEMLLDTTAYFDFSLSNSAITTASISGGKLIYTGVGSSGSTSYLYIDIPLFGAEQVSFKLIASNTSTLGSIPIIKQLLTSNKSVIETWTEGTGSFGASSQSVVGGLRTVKNIPPAAAFLRLTFNGFYLNSTNSFTIESLKVWKA